MVCSSPLNHHIDDSVIFIFEREFKPLKAKKNKLIHPLTIEWSSDLATHILLSSKSNSSVVLHPVFTPSSSLDQQFLPIDLETRRQKLLINGTCGVSEKEGHVYQIDEIDRQAVGLYKKIEDLFKDVKNLEEDYDQHYTLLKEQGGVQGNILSTLEYFKANQVKLLNTFSSHFSFQESLVIKDQLKRVNEGFKWTNCMVPLMLHIAKFCMANQIQGELERLRKRFQELKLQATEISSQSLFSCSHILNRVQSHMDELERQLLEDQQTALLKGRLKLDKLASRVSSIPLEKIVGVAAKKANKIGKSTITIYAQLREIFCNLRQAYKAQSKWMEHLSPRIVVNINCPISPTFQEELYQEVTHFLKSLEICKTIKEVQQKLKKVKITEIPSNFDDWLKLFKTKRFRRYLVQSYYYCAGKRAFMQPSHIQSLLHRREAERKKKIDQSLPFIYYHIGKSQHLDLTQLTAYFDRLHIHLNQIKLANSDLPLPPKSKDEWNQCIRDTEFCKALATQWIDYQETTAQLAMQMMRQALLSKNNVERKFLAFRMTEYSIKIASAITQLALCLPQAKLWLAASVLELFVTDLAKLGIPGMGLLPIFYPLYSDITFKLDSLIMMIAEHFFAIKYKPNEYSLQGYKLAFQIRWLGFVAGIHYFISLFKQLLLWLNMRLIENCMLGLEKKPIEQDSRYIQINETYQRRRLKCKSHIHELKAYLNKLRIEDVKLMISSCQQAGSKQEAIDPIEQLIAALEDMNFDLLPPEVRQFFEENLGLKLTEANKIRLRKNIQQFFSNNESQFVKFYQASHWAYLRV